MSWKVCSTPGCPNLIDHGSKCASCSKAAERKRRPRGNPYSNPGHRRFRREVLARDPLCVCPGAIGLGGCGRHEGLCGNPSSVADHYPYERGELIEMGRNPDDPEFGRGLCKACHDRKTAKTRPFGFREV